MATQVASIFGVLSLNDSNFRSGMQNARQNLNQFGDATRRGIGGLQQFGSSMALLSAPLLALGAVGLSTASDFDASMRMISARTGLVGDDLQQIADYAIQMGADTIFSAQEASDAFLQLLSSGQSAEQAIATLPDVLNLAAASGEDLGRTADVLTDIMAAYGLAVQDASFVSDVLARAAGASSADVGSLGQGFANVGGVAHQFGLSVDETASILAIFSENGIKGAEAGTTLKSMLLNMTRPTEDVASAWTSLGVSFYDAQGNARPLPQVLAEMDAALDPLPAQMQNEIMQALAGSYGITGLAALRGSISIDEMQASMAAQADAASIAETMMGGFGVTVDSLKGSFEALMINALTPLMNDHLAPLINTHLIPLVNKVSEWVTKNPELATKIVLVTGAVALFGVGVGIAGAAIGAITGAIGGLLLFALSPLGLALIVGVGLILAYKNNWLGFRDFVNNSVRPALEELLRLLKEIGEFLGQAGLAWENLGNINTLVSTGQVSPQQLQGAIGNEAQNQMNNLGKGMLDAIINFGKIINPSALGGGGAGLGYALGGYTGAGASGEVAGMVHRNEWVVPEGGALVMRGGGGDININEMTVITDSPEAFMRQMEDMRRRRG